MYKICTIADVKFKNKEDGERSVELNPTATPVAQKAAPEPGQHLSPNPGHPLDTCRVNVTGPRTSARTRILPAVSTAVRSEQLQHTDTSIHPFAWRTRGTPPGA